ncbi:MAG: hypothetical protein FWE32_02780 [Oscillospiraceae bacterium]|nr:hypothetical protein [Oscillospiraceae bacterium]
MKKIRTVRKLLVAAVVLLLVFYFVIAPYLPRPVLRGSFTVSDDLERVLQEDGSSLSGSGDYDNFIDVVVFYHTISDFQNLPDRVRYDRLNLTDRFDQRALVDLLSQTTSRRLVTRRSEAIWHMLDTPSIWMISTALSDQTVTVILDRETACGYWYHTPHDLFDNPAIYQIRDPIAVIDALEAMLAGSEDT